jgi:large subunit ribosomal protein L13
MLPYKKPRGKEALARIKFHIGNEENKKELKTIEQASSKRLTTTKYMKIKEITKLLGGKV